LKAEQMGADVFCLLRLYVVVIQCVAKGSRWSRCFANFSE